MLTHYHLLPIWETYIWTKKKYKKLNINVFRHTQSKQESFEEHMIYT